MGTKRLLWHTTQMSLVDLARLEEGSAGNWSSQYQLRDPFPHLVLENFLLADPDAVVGSFPDLDWDGWTERGGGAMKFQPGKRACRDIEAIPSLLQQIIYELSAPRFLRVLSDLTGIPGLLPDPFLEGGGIHCTTPGGKLTPHTDFHNPPHLKLFRRANVLLFLNPDWKAGDGGELGLFNLGEDTPSVSVSPVYGNCVIFTTDHRSVHGVNPIAESANLRRSIALYYYTVEPAEGFSGDRKTYWYEPFEATAKSGSIYTMRLFALKTTLNASKKLAKIAYRMDPQHPIT